MNSNLTDRAPVFVACLGLDWGDKLTPLSLADAATRQLAGLCEARRDLADRRTQLLNQLIACLKEFYPRRKELAKREGSL